MRSPASQAASENWHVIKIAKPARIQLRPREITQSTGVNPRMREKDLKPAAAQRAIFAALPPCVRKASRLSGTLFKDSARLLREREDVPTRSI